MLFINDDTSMKEINDVMWPSAMSEMKIEMISVSGVMISIINVSKKSSNDICEEKYIK